MFEWLVHSKTRLRMMKMFFKDIEKPLYGLEIAQALKASPGTTHRELNAMLKQNVLKKSKEGALVLYRLNTAHPYFQELKRAVFPPKKKTNRTLFISDLHLSLETSDSVLEDLHLLIDYAEENATELVLLGDMVEMLKGDVFSIYLYHKPVFDRLVRLAHNLKVTYVVGNHDPFLRMLCQDGQEGRFMDTKITFGDAYYNTKLNIFATHGHQVDELNKGKAKLESCADLAKALKNSRNAYHQELSRVLDYAEKAKAYAQYISRSKKDSSADLIVMAKELIHEQDYSYVVMGHGHKAMLKELGHGIYFNTGSWKSEKNRQFVEIDKEGGALVAMSELR